MNFFDSLIEESLSSLSALSRKSCAYRPGNSWKDVGYNQVIMQRDSVFELDGTGFNLVTSNHIDDEVTVIGPELSEIKTGRKFARISIIELEDIEDDQKAYNLIRKVEYVKYHHFPDGYMIRTSSRSHKEVVRVSKKAISSGISFEKIGNLLIEKYKENPAVKGVRVIFVSDDKADFRKIEKIAQSCHDITETLNHIMNSVNFDCDSCNLKPICDEVEGMKELHFKNSSMM